MHKENAVKPIVAAITTVNAPVLAGLAASVTMADALLRIVAVAVGIVCTILVTRHQLRK